MKTLRAFIKKETGWLILVFFTLGMFAVTRTYSVSFISKIVELLEKSEPVSEIMKMAFLGFVIAAASYVLRYLGSVLCIRLTEKLALETRYQLIGHLQKISYLRFEQMKTGQLQTVLRNDVQQGSDVIYTVFSRILLNVQLFIATFVYMMMIQPWLAVCVSVIILLMAFMNQRILVKQKRYQKRSRDAAGEVGDAVLSICKGMDTIKAYGKQNFASGLFETAKRVYNQNTYRVEQIDAGRLTAYNLANYATLYATVFYFGYRGIHDGAIIGDVLVFIVLLRQMMMPAEVVFRWMSTLVEALAAWERIDEILQIPEEETEAELPQPEQEVCAEQLRFGYEKDKLMFDGLQLSFRKGELSLLRGRSGCGKTTLCKVLCGLYREASVSWRIDEKDNLHGTPKRWVTYSPADAQIFSMSIYENLVFDHKEIAREICMEMADELGIGDWIRSLPQGIDTQLSAGGKNCSGGQRQMMMNMRALLSDKPVLILDEACSALDTEKRTRLMNYLHKVKKEKAVLMITHQEEVMKQCDREILLHTS